MKPVLTIGNKNYSSWSLRPWILLTHFGVDFAERVIPLDTPRFADEIGALSPSRRVPALEHDGLVVWDSLAICEYANEAWLAGRGWPSDRAARAVARSVVAEMHSGFQVLRAECPMNVRRTVPRSSISPELERDVARVRALWTEVRARFGAGGGFLFGDFSIADAFYAPVAARFRTYGLPAGDVEKAYIDAIFALPAMRRWVADAGAEVETLPKYDAVGA